jgi:hypothetical protein
VARLRQTTHFQPKTRRLHQPLRVYTNYRLPTKKGMFFFHDLYIYPINDFTGKLPYHNANASTDTNASNTKKGPRNVVADVS